jgi:tetratricopeptide (TPR) repeat protein
MAVPKSNPEQRFKFGVSCLKTGAVDRAREAFAEAVEAEPENGLYLAHFHYSRYLIDQSAAKGVIARLKDLARDDEGRETALLFLGHIERGRGKLDLATKYYRLCLRMNPRNVEAKRQMRLFDMRTSKRKTGVLERLFSKPGKKRS